MARSSFAQISFNWFIQFICLFVFLFLSHSFTHIHSLNECALIFFREVMEIPKHLVSEAEKAIKMKLKPIIDQAQV